MEKIFTCLIVSFFILTLIGCKESATTASVSGAGVFKGPDNDEGVSAKEIADALGMHRIIADIPQDAVLGDSYGIAIKHKDGYSLSGFSAQKPGDRLKVIYWVENKFLKYSIQSSGGSVIGYLEIGNPIEFKMKSVPNVGTLYKVGDIFEKWSVNENMTSRGNAPEQLEEGEVGICLLKSVPNLRSAPMNVVPRQVNNKF